MIVFYIFSADGRNKSRKPCSSLIAFGKCYQSCKLNHTVSSGNVTASMKMNMNMMMNEDTSDQKRKIFHFLNNKGRKAIITRFAEPLGMNEVAEAYLLGSSLIEKEDTGPFKKRKKIQICL